MPSCPVLVPKPNNPYAQEFQTALIRLAAWALMFSLLGAGGWLGHYELDWSLFLALFGLVVLVRQRQVSWLWLVLVIASFALVHLFFWSNMRMRAPVIPAIALIAALAASQRFAVYAKQDAMH